MRDHSFQASFLRTSIATSPFYSKLGWRVIPEVVHTLELPRSSPGLLSKDSRSPDLYHLALGPPSVSLDPPSDPSESPLSPPSLSLLLSKYSSLPPSLQFQLRSLYSLSSLPYMGPLARSQEYWESWVTANILEESWVVLRGRWEGEEGGEGRVEGARREEGGEGEGEVVGYIAFEIPRKPEDRNPRKLNEIFFKEGVPGLGPKEILQICSAILGRGKEEGGDNEGGRREEGEALKIKWSGALKLGEEREQREESQSVWMLQLLGEEGEEGLFSESSNFMFWGCDSF
jgi:hypothetical protein